MSISHYYILDAQRALQHGNPIPPLPGDHDLRTARALRDERRFRAMVAERPARGRRLRAVVRSFLTRSLRSAPALRHSSRRPSQCRERH